jgi:hypothetical protein
MIEHPPETAMTDPRFPAAAPTSAPATTTTAPADPSFARFSFKSRRLEVEFEGRDDFVTAQIQHMRAGFFREDPPAASAAGAAPSPAGAAAAGTPGTAAVSGPPSLEDFYRRAKSRQGRGALQETILIFAYFLREHRGQEEFGIDNLNACFSLVGVTPPRSLANTLGIMKRTQKFFHSGSRRGQYTLTEKGSAYVKRLIGA